MGPENSQTLSLGLQDRLYPHRKRQHLQTREDRAKEVRCEKNVSLT
jgi:hypothetical protein